MMKQEFIQKHIRGIKFDEKLNKKVKHIFEVNRIGIIDSAQRN
jgi:hypothetical protein